MHVGRGSAWGSAQEGAGAAGWWPRGSVWAALRFLDASGTAVAPSVSHCCPASLSPATAPHAGAQQLLHRGAQHTWASFVPVLTGDSGNSFSLPTLRVSSGVGVRRAGSCFRPRQWPPVSSVAMTCLHQVGAQGGPLGLLWAEVGGRGDTVRSHNLVVFSVIFPSQGQREEASEAAFSKRCLLTSKRAFI